MSDEGRQADNDALPAGTSEAETAAWEQKVANPEEPNAGDKMTTGAKFANVLESDPNMQWEAKIADKVTSDEGEPES